MDNLPNLDSGAAKSPELWSQSGKIGGEDSWSFGEIDTIPTETAENLVPKQPTIAVPIFTQDQDFLDDPMGGAENFPCADHDLDSFHEPCTAERSDLEEESDLDEPDGNDDATENTRDHASISNEQYSGSPLAKDGAAAAADALGGAAAAADRTVFPGTHVLVKWDRQWAPETDGWSAGIVRSISDGRRRNPNGAGVVTRGWAIVEYAAGDRHVHLLDAAHHADAWGDREMAWRRLPGPPQLAAAAATAADEEGEDSESAGSGGPGRKRGRRRPVGLARAPRHRPIARQGAAGAGAREAAAPAEATLETVSSESAAAPRCDLRARGVGLPRRSRIASGFGGRIGRVRVRVAGFWRPCPARSRGRAPGLAGRRDSTATPLDPQLDAG
jgi:hypothetical protein